MQEKKIVGDKRSLMAGSLMTGPTVFEMLGVITVHISPQCFF